jgi:hypothetical protein
MINFSMWRVSGWLSDWAWHRLISERNVSAWQPSIIVALFALPSSRKQLHRRLRPLNSRQTLRNRPRTATHSTMTVWLICHYFISPRWFLVTAEKEPTSNVKQTTMKTRNWFLFRPNWNVEDDLFEFLAFLFSSMTFSCLFPLQSRNLWKRVDLTLKHFNLSLDL